jgi:hypothetical protein
MEEYDEIASEWDATEKFIRRKYRDVLVEIELVYENDKSPEDQGLDTWVPWHVGLISMIPIIRGADGGLYRVHEDDRMEYLPRYANVHPRHSRIEVSAPRHVEEYHKRRAAANRQQAMLRLQHGIIIPLAQEYLAHPRVRKRKRAQEEYEMLKNIEF